MVLPGVEGVIAKWASSMTSARMLKPSLAQQAVGEAREVLLHVKPKL